MRLIQQYLTNNACYKAGVKFKPAGVMVHSTGANNPNLKRYVPGNAEIGFNTGGNHWNTYTPDGRKVCVHAFIGKTADGSIATVQTLPWNVRGWHCGGAGNDTLIGFEICEDNLTDAAYFAAVYREAVELCAYLCNMYGLRADSVICHAEGYKRGIASNHGDVLHWFPKFGKDMNTFRADVKKEMEKAGDKMEKEKRYNTLEEIPEYGKRAIEYMIDHRIFADPKKLDLSEDMLRVLVFGYRMHVL